MSQNFGTIGFPRELLLMPASERKAYFEDVVINHTKLENAINQAKKRILDNKIPIILLYGPSGVGKSTLLSKLWSFIRDMMAAELELNKGIYPAVLVEAKAPEIRRFNWGELFQSLLIALNEPCIEHKVLPIHIFRTDPMPRQTRTVSALRSSYESALEHRKPAAVLIDEAQHTAKTATGTGLLDQMDVFKSLANRTKIPHLLAGTYELLPFRNLSAQLSNRSIDIHLPRYMADNEDDIEAFRNIINWFQNCLPVENVDLDSHSQFLYERSIGCVGVLKKWLERALDECLSDPENNGSCLTYKHLEDTALTVTQCRTMAEDALTGENKLKVKEDDREILLRKLKLISDGGDEIPAMELVETKEDKAKKRKRKPGERNPMRDQVGL